MKRHVLFLSIFLLAGGIAFAQRTADIPKVISYQGLLTSNDGSPLADGEYRITVTLYGDENGSDRIWQDTYVAKVLGGIFNIYLGSGTIPLPAPDRMNKALWVGTKIEMGDEMRPLTRLSATPYAINVPDNAITTDKLADGAVTANKVDMDYIAGVSVNGKEIVGKGTVLKIQAGKDINIDYDDATQSLIIGAPAVPGNDGALDDKQSDRELAGTQQDAWTMRGDGVDVVTAAVIAPVAGDWIGTSNNVDFNTRVRGIQIMSYQSKVAGQTPNVVGGDVGNSVTANAVGCVIAGGGLAGAATVNTIDGDTYNTISGGQANKIHNQMSDFNVISGGQTNTIGSNVNKADHAAIAGGEGNTVIGDHGAVGGGQRNEVNASHSVVDGGQENIVSASHSGIGGGFQNRIFGPLSAIGGGNGNVVNMFNGTIGGGQGNFVNMNHGFVGGGQANSVNMNHGAIAGGEGNTTGGDHSFVGGGLANTAGAQFATIAGGERNMINMPDGFIGGGVFNQIFGFVGTIAGGENNILNGDYSSIGGGFFNQTVAPFGRVGGGQNNVAAGPHSFVGGGQGNVASGEHAVVAGGMQNFAGGQRSVVVGGEFNSANGERSAVVGGTGNHAHGPRGFVGGGESNIIHTDFNHSVIGGGKMNNISGAYNVIGGGFGNTNNGIESVIGGGTGNNIDMGVTKGVIGGGGNNRIMANMGAGVAATIPGGQGLIAQSFAQTVIGVANIQKGNVMPFGAVNNDPIFIIGNGTNGIPSNAFEVSYNGHSTVFHTLGDMADVRLGSTYTDNVIYSWGDVGFAGARRCDFGVKSIERKGAGWYRVTMRIADANGNPVNLSCGSVTATLSSDNVPMNAAVHSCRFIRTSRIGNNNVFDIYISEHTIVNNALQCTGVDDAFMFKVTGRAGLTPPPPPPPDSLGLQ